MKGRGLRSLVEVTPRGQLPMEQHMEDIYDVYLLPPHLDAV